MQASSETKIKRYPYTLNLVHILLGIGMCLKVLMMVIYYDFLYQSD